MNDFRRIPVLFAKLIKACGGLEEASQACRDGCRPYSVQQLSRCQTPGSGCFPPQDIVWCLESYCGDNIMSDAGVKRRPAEAGPVADIASEAVDVAQAATALLPIALSFKSSCPKSYAALVKAMETLRDEMADVDAAAAPHLRAVT